MGTDQAESSPSVKATSIAGKDKAGGGSNPALPRGPADSQNSPARSETYAVTSESRISGARVNHVTTDDSARATSTCSAETTRGALSASSNQQVEHPSPQIHTAESASEESKRKALPLKAPPNEKKDTVVGRTQEKNMCIAEPQEQRSDDNKKKSGGKMYEIPLTILPGEDQEAPTKQARKKTKPEGVSTGRWTYEEHQAFLEGLKVFGREWKKVATRIPTRTSAQIRSHAQKYFSKLAREETLLRHEPSAVAAAQPQEEQQQQQQLPMSVQRTAERILANPTGAQAEVEDTLRQLRERYRQLQIRLEASQRARGLPPMDRIVEDPGNDGDGSIPAGLIHRGGHAPGLDRRKRTLEEANLQDDGASSVSSDLSHSLASLSPKREFGNEELIALHVLGGSLPRSASGTDLQEHSRSSSFSEAEDSEAKRQRLGGESNDHSEGGGGDSDGDQDGDEAMI